MQAEIKIANETKCSYCVSTVRVTTDHKIIFNVRCLSCKRKNKIYFLRDATSCK